MTAANKKVSLYILAGFATSSNFMDDFIRELKQHYEKLGAQVAISMLFPYGDWNRTAIKQLFEISGDLMPRFGRKRHYLRGHKVADYIKASYTGGEIVIIGHSSGGVVGVHAAKLLHAEQLPIARVVQIGSPKCSISFSHQASTMFIYGMNAKGHISDPVTRIGSWGGWEKNGSIFRWNPRRYAPASIVGVPILGGHADYFRNTKPFIDGNGAVNLEKITNHLWEWLEGDV